MDIIETEYDIFKVFLDLAHKHFKLKGDRMYLI